MKRFFDLEKKIVVKILQKKINLEAYLVIDSIFFNRSVGGIRISPTVDEKEVSELARCMTLKNLFLDSKVGGAKAGIRAGEDIKPEEKRILLSEFGKAILPYLENQIYLPGPDMGTKSEDISRMLSDIGIRKRGNPSPSSFDSGYYTALSVFISVEEASSLCNVDIKTSSVAIEGFGSVGSSLANLFYLAGAKIVAVSSRSGAIYNPKGLNISKLIKIKEEYTDDVVKFIQGEEKISREKLFELPVEILCPCAGMKTIDEHNVHSIKASIIGPGANLPIAEDMEPILFKKNIFSIPHFVANSGGLLSSGMESYLLNHATICDLFGKYLRERLHDLFERSTSNHKMPLEVAMADIDRKIEELNKESQNSQKKLIHLAKKSIRKVIPRFALKWIGPHRFKKMLLKR